jgi:hypothetical protein
VRPAQPKKSTKVRKTPAPAANPAASTFADPRPLRPIGPAALQELREAIRSGRYPTDAAVRAGMERLLRRPE